MHELSIALSIIDIASEEAQRLGASAVAAVHLRIGPLSGIVKEALTSAFELAREGSALDQSSLVFEEVPITLFCRKCDRVQPAKSIIQLCCATCGTAGSEIKSGREFEIVAMEIEQ